MALDLSCVGKTTAPTVVRYGWKDIVLYALSIGAKKAELDFLYEGRGPKVIPSFAVVPMFAPMLAALEGTKGDFATIVHGGQKVRLHAPFPREGELSTTATVRAIYDMRKFAFVVCDMQTKDADGAVVCDTSANIIYRGEGGFGGSPPPKEEKVAEAPKDRAPDFRIEEVTSPEQGLLYRLNGDVNPLHADPTFAASVGFAEGPILHGLCTYGYMVRHAARGACLGDATQIVEVAATFRKPVWPGDTLVTEGWRLDGGRIALKVGVKERDEQVLTQAWVRTA